MAKKRNASAAGTSISQDLLDLKTLNSDLVKEVAELRKQIGHLSSRLDSLIANRGSPDSTDRDVLGHVHSSTLGEAEAHSNAHIVEAIYKPESAAVELNAMEMPLLPLGEQDAVENELELIIEGSDITHYSPEKIRKKSWIFIPVAITAVVFVSTAVVSLCKSTKLKK